MKSPLIKFYKYQEKVFLDRLTRIILLCWSRQIGKSFTLAAWIVDRLLTRPGRLVTVLSNSRDNGAELLQKVKEVCEKMRAAIEILDLSPDASFETMCMEARIKVGGKVGRVKVLAANPRTARGFSGDLILDEFAFHQDSRAIWEAAEPILSSNPDFLCRIASTLNGRFNMFYQMMTSDIFPVSKVTRTEANAMGRKVYHPVTGKEITPAEARALALDKRAYDQNYECMVADENSTLLTHELISSAIREDCGVICEQSWSEDALSLLASCKGSLVGGMDVGRNHDHSTLTVAEDGPIFRVRAILRMDNMLHPDQMERIGQVVTLPNFRKLCIDYTGIGTGLTEFSQRAYGEHKVQGIHFGSTVATTDLLKLEGRKSPTAKITEAMAVHLQAAYMDRRIEHPMDPTLRENLMKPERISLNDDTVRIAATRDEAGHADDFWSMALCLWAASSQTAPFEYSRIVRPTALEVARYNEERCLAA